jgi:hypothetical protein
LRPPLSPVLQPLNGALSGHARKVGSARLVTGAGGDNLFCYLTTTAPLTISVRRAGSVRTVKALSMPQE